MQRDVPVAGHLVLRKDLQGLRALAVSLVVFHHAGVEVLAGGFVGVDVFFVLSGYLITGLLLREQASTGRIDYPAFLARRLRRLLPSLLVVVLAVCALATALLSRQEFVRLIGSVLAALTWTSNFHFAFTQFDYFAELAARDLFLHTWSLAVEEQFYLVWPWLVWAALWRVSSDRVAPDRVAPDRVAPDRVTPDRVAPDRVAPDRVAPDRVVAVLLLVAVGSLALCLYWSLREPLWSFYLMPSRMWQFALGALLAVGHLESLRPAPGFAFGVASSSRESGHFNTNPHGGSGRVRIVAVWIGLALILGSAVGLHERLVYPGWWALLPSTGAALVIVGGGPHGVSSSRWLSRAPLVWLGDRSYVWYLWHWPLFMVGFSLGLQNDVTAVGFLILLSLALAALTHIVVERPFWKGRYSQASAVRTLVFSGAAMLFAVLAILPWTRVHLEALEEGRAGTAVDPRQDVPPIYTQGCDAGNNHDAVQPCLRGPADAPKTAVLLGDSIGLQWYSMWSELYPAPAWRLVILTKSACPMVDEEIFYVRIGQVYRVCSRWREAVLDVLPEFRPDVVVLGSASTYAFDGSQWTEGTARLLARLSEIADEIIVVPGTGLLSFDGPGCLERWREGLNDVTGSEALPDRVALDRVTPDRVALDRVAPDRVTPDLGAENLRLRCGEKLQVPAIAEVTGYLRTAVARFPKARFLDLNDRVCPDGFCSALSPEGIVVFRDSQHLTDTFVRRQIPMVRERLGLPRSAVAPPGHP